MTNTPEIQNERRSRRIDAIVAALTDSDGNPLAVDLLATDSSDPTHVVALRQLARHAEFIVSSQLTAPLAGQPLGDLVEALVEDPGCSPRELACKAVERGGAGSKALWERCQDLLGERVPSASPGTIAAARRLLRVGQDGVALQSSSVSELAKAVDNLGRGFLDLLKSGAESKLERSLGEWHESTGRDSGVLTGDLGQLGALVTEFEAGQESLRTSAAALATAVAATVVARCERRDYAENQRPLSGISLAQAACQPGCEGCGTSSWAEVFDTLDPTSKSQVEQRTLADISAWAHRASIPSVAEQSTPEPFRWIEYGTRTLTPNFDAEEDLRAFLDEQLATSRHVRHLGVVVRGWTTPERPYSVAILGAVGEFLPIATIASCLRDALHEHGRGSVALLVLDDWRLLSLEVAYEFREVAKVLVTGTEPAPGGAATESLARLPSVDAIVRTSEQQAADALARADWTTHEVRPQFGEIARDWRWRVATGLAEQLLGSDETMQAINLQFIEGLCRRFDWVCQIMLDHLHEPLIWNVLGTGFLNDRLITLINQGQVRGIYLKPNPRGLAECLNEAMGAVYNWVRTPGKPIERGGVPFWIGDRVGDYATRLLVETNDQRAKAYLDLSFHKDVRLQALLAAWRLLEENGGRQLWGLITLGLSHGPRRAVREQLEQVDSKHAQDLEQFFTTFGPPPLITLGIEPIPNRGYDLRLSSSEPSALVDRRRRQIDLDAIESSCQGLDFLLEQANASREVWSYLESLGSSLAEDVLGDLDARLEEQRLEALHTGRGRDAHLALALPLELMPYPWELMRVPTPNGPDQFLSDRFAMGRQILSASGRRSKKAGDGRLRVLIVGDPSGQLPGAQAEARFVSRVCTEVQQALGSEMDFQSKRDLFVGETVTRATLRRLLRDGDYDVLHFAGHGSFSSERPEDSGWVLSDGTLTATELRNTLAWLKSPPWLIFANACSAAMTSDDRSPAYQGAVHGIADACISEGVSAFIAPLWKVNDKSAQLLASEFYRALLINRATVGVALHRARRHTRKIWEYARGRRGIEDISWAGVILFGNPTQRIGENVPV